MIYIKLKQIRIGLSFWFFFMFATVCVFDTNGILWCSLFTALLHEMGHILAMYIKHDMPKSIDIHIFNVDIIDNNRTKRSPNDDIFILICGGLFNIILALLSIIIYKFSNNYYVSVFFTTNLILGVFNLLPISTLDGGQIVEIMLLKRLNIKSAQIISDVISLIILLPLAILGFIVLLQSKYNFSLLVVSLYLIGLLVFKHRAYL